ncbi:thiamine diphosphokinase [Halpernia frigidisoli]|uniref:Thiamine diphosphokinase n=1 Tax=Halpernia frigidisoli TaxID=1125876 RepID=A0A1I3J1I6_9FLAO|nr:thiamine diphosphokinase [Halpernia frigidisoli]SFI54060.1 thiamine pyrophosphokinase [Halpernia frigidisoli]
MKSLLFINGIPPKQLPEMSGYQIIACTDGAFHYLKEMNFPFEKLDFISGDFDSHSGKDETVYDQKFIYTPDQNKTDFQKALEILEEKGIQELHVFGGSGGEMDHFLGNLSVAYLFKEKLKITFYDEFSTYFFSPKNLALDNVKDKMISLYPFPTTENLTTKGLEWQLNKENLNIQTRIGTRNQAIENHVEITFEKGELIIFLHH